MVIFDILDCRAVKVNRSGFPIESQSIPFCPKNIIMIHCLEIIFNSLCKQSGQLLLLLPSSFYPHSTAVWPFYLQKFTKFTIIINDIIRYDCFQLLLLLLLLWFIGSCRVRWVKIYRSGLFSRVVSINFRIPWELFYIFQTLYSLFIMKYSYSFAATATAQYFFMIHTTSLAILFASICVCVCVKRVWL